VNYDIYQMKNISSQSVINALSNATRFRSILLLLEREELCVCEINDVIGEAQPNISRNLGHLKESGLVIDRREGRWIYYRINPDLPDWAIQILLSSKAGSNGHEPFESDLAKLSSMACNVDNKCCA